MLSKRTELQLLKIFDLWFLFLIWHPCFCLSDPLRSKNASTRSSRLVIPTSALFLIVRLKGPDPAPFSSREKRAPLLFWLVPCNFGLAPFFAMLLSLSLPPFFTRPISFWPEEPGPLPDVVPHSASPPILARPMSFEPLFFDLFWFDA